MFSNKDLSDIIGQTFANGGCTYRVGMLTPTDGYMVAMNGRERIIPAINFTVETLRKYVEDNSAVLTDWAVYLGTWLHCELVYLDVSVRVMNRAEALELGRRNGQLAVYDLATGEEIPVLMPNSNEKGNTE